MFLFLFLSLAPVTWTATQTYRIEVWKSKRPHSSSNSPHIITIIGTQGKFTEPIRDFFMSVKEDVGELKSVELEAKGDDAFLFTDVRVRSSRDNIHVSFYNYQKQWLSTDTTEGVRKIFLNKQGDNTYTINIFTGSQTYAGSESIGLSLTLHGTKGIGEAGFMEATSNVNGWFENGSQEEFTRYNMPDLGKVVCVMFSVTGSDAWYFDRVVVGGGEGGDAVFENKDRVWLSSVADEGRLQLSVCNYD